MNIQGLIIPEQRALIIAGAAVLVVGLQLFLRRTMTGSTILAMAQNREGAFLVGIDANRVAMMTFAISGMLAAFAATLYAPDQPCLSGNGAPGDHEGLRDHHHRWHGQHSRCRDRRHDHRFHRGPSAGSISRTTIRM